ncbi:uncharacterized protein LOC143445876 [Clavelina lepadiformis]|uniref:uncharacterized protein LOC143445876 n=1 Tax=Clavelina lepadiformis TaxID=159417 RepID=UPI004042E52D
MIQYTFIVTFSTFLLSALPTSGQNSSPFELGRPQEIPTAEPFRPDRTTPTEPPNPFLPLFHRFTAAPKQLPYPLTLELCRRDRALRQLLTCQAAIHRPALLRKLANKYLCPQRDFWKPDKNLPSIRKKRDINDCQGPPHRNVIMEAEDAANPGVMRQLLHDPGNYIFQTLFVQQCSDFPPVGEYYHCSMHQVKFEAAVWSLNPGHPIEVIEVFTNGYCALSRN